MTPDTIIDGILRAEGSAYTNDPADSGGPTKYGITQATLSAFRGYAVTPDDVAELTEAEARQIYFKRYWLEPRINLLGAHSMKVAAEVMDTGVNAGPSVAVSMLQRALNAFNDRGQLYADLVVDGKAGPATAAALAAFLRRRGVSGEDVLHAALNCLQGAFYTDLVERREKDERFYFGWLRERVAHQL